jgi:hypothetical protein
MIMRTWRGAVRPKDEHADHYEVVTADVDGGVLESAPG